MNTLTRPTRNACVLVIDDNAADALLTTDALHSASGDTDVVVIDSAEAALVWLRTGNRAHLVLLDLNLPGMTGMEMLDELKADLVLRTLPVIVLSSSTRASDIASSYERRASSYVTKPMDFAAFTEVIESIDDFWLTTAELPR